MAMQNLGRLISLPLERLHIANCANLDDPIEWVLYPQRDNLFCVFDTVELNINRTKHRLLKIVNGARIMEEMDLDMLVQNASAAGMIHQAQGLDGDILVLARSPQIAMRYQKSSGQIRFTNDADYQTAISALSQVQFPIRFMGPTQATTASASKLQTLARQAWGSQSMTQSVRRDTSFHQGLLQRPSTSGEALQRAVPWGYTGAPASVLAEDASQHQLQLRRCQTSYQPTSTDTGSGVRFPQTPMQDFRTDSSWASSSPVLVPTLPESQNSHSNHQSIPSSSHQEFSTPFRFPTTIPETPPLATSLPTSSGQASSPGLSHGSLVSALDLQQTMSQIMPPKRELPFAKPVRSGKPKPSRIEVNTRPPRPKLDLPELPKPTLRPVSRGIAALRKPSPNDCHPVGGPCRKPPSFLKPREDSPSTSQAAPPLDGRELIGVGHRETTPEPCLPGGFHEPQAPKDRIVSPPVSTAEAAEALKPPLPQGQLQDEDLRYMDAFVQKHINYEQRGGSDDLSRLAALSSEDRQAEIDTMICSLIHDENFYQLLEALENSWRRIGFDLHR
ncbi:hypothetical protein FGG08_006239 [Glutinoglossum americanum]|uniref:Uncharacterized protein n=1 Tax=Glutinoglossum americanum TaxID=1670608 RepID=A0A9P8I1C2_9PEZI|nr:hypothetical protein FGG08_006239 [Glutinoglossum americanum]